MHTHTPYKRFTNRMFPFLASALKINDENTDDSMNLTQNASMTHKVQFSN